MNLLLRRLVIGFGLALSWVPVCSAQSLVAAVLPSSRSVQVGTPATAFVTIINTGSSAAAGVGISLSTAISANFRYQTTDPTTNALIGTPNTPVDIPGGASRTFVIEITPTAPFAPLDVAFNFTGSNTPQTATLTGINTLLLSASATPIPDIIALAATLNNDGIVRQPGATGTGVFAVATANVGGGAGLMTVSGDTASATLPVTISVCQTSPVTGACLAPPASSVTAQINTGATPTFGLFVAGHGLVPSDAAANRVFVRFKDGTGVTRGATSVAVRTTLPIRGLYVQFERRGWPSGYYNGELVRLLNTFDAVLAHTPAEEVGLQLDVMRAMGVNTITYELRTSANVCGEPDYTNCGLDLSFPQCLLSHATGFLWPQPTSTELTNLVAFFDLLEQKGMRVLLRLVNTHMEEQPPTNSRTWLGAILGVVKDHPALDLVLFEGNTHVIDTNGDGIPDACGIPAEPPLWLGPTSVPAQYVKWAITFAQSLGIPARMLSAEAVIGNFQMDSQGPAGPEATDRHLWSPIAVLKTIFDELGIPASERSYAVSFYEANKCATARSLPCTDIDPHPWAEQTLQSVRAIIGTGNGARVIAVEMGDMTPDPAVWQSDQALASLISLMLKYDMDGGSFWRWTSFLNSEDADPTQALPVKRRGVNFIYNPVKNVIQQMY